eukprot:g44352.t1
MRGPGQKGNGLSHPVQIGILFFQANRTRRSTVSLKVVKVIHYIPLLRFASRLEAILSSSSSSSASSSLPSQGTTSLPYLPLSWQLPPVLRHRVLPWIGSQRGMDALLAQESLPKATAFVNKALPATDYILACFLHSDLDNPLAETICETILLLRETLSCWLRKRLHHVALESVRGRLARLRHEVTQMESEAEAKFSGELDLSKKPGSGFRHRKLEVRLQDLWDCERGEALLDLRQVRGVLMENQGKEPDFCVVYVDKTQALAASPDAASVKKLYCRAPSDPARQYWANIFYLAAQRNKASLALAECPVGQRAYVYCTVVYTPMKQSGPDDSGPSVFQHLNKEREFLFATSSAAEPDVLKLQIAKPSELTAKDSLVENRSKVAVVDRFDCVWPQMLGKDKPRIIEIDLNEPHRISFLKPSKESGPPERILICEREHLVDFKVEEKKLEVVICILTSESQGKVTKAHRFPNTIRFRRFTELLTMFQSPPDEHRICFLNQDVLHAVQHLTSEQNKEISAEQKQRLKAMQREVQASHESLDIFQGQLHRLFCVMANSCPTNTHCWELMQRSHSFPLTTEGDELRVQLLLDKIYAFDIEGHLDTYECQCNPGTKITSLPKQSSAHLPANCDRPCFLLLLKSFLSNDGIEDLRRLLESRNERLQQLTLLAIFQVFNTKHLVGKCEGVVVASGVDENYWRPAAYPLQWYINNMARTSQLSSATVDTMFRILIGEIGQVVEALRKQQAGQPAEHEPVEVMQKDIRFQWFLPSVLSCLKSSNTKATQEGLQNIVHLVKKDNNAKAFLDVQGWQKWIYPILFEKGRQLIDENSMNYKLTITILSNLHYLSLSQRDCKGILHHNVMFESIVILRRLHLRFDEQSSAIGRVLFTTLMKMIENRKVPFTQNFDFSEFTYENFFVILSVVEEFIFYTRDVGPQERENWLSFLRHHDQAPSSDDLKKIEFCALWVDEKKNCRDEKLVETVLSTMEALQLNRTVKDSTHDVTASEKQLLKKAEIDMEFWRQISLNMKGFSKVSPESQESRLLLLNSISRLLSERNKKQKERVYPWRKGKTVLVIV